MKIILTLIISSLLLSCGCNMFGPEGDISPSMQNTLVKKAAAVATQAGLINGIKDIEDRKLAGAAVVFYGEASRSVFKQLVEENVIDLSLVELYLSNVVDDLNNAIIEIVGIDIGVDLEVVKMAIPVLLNQIAPDGVKKSVGLEGWQVELILSFFDGIIEGGNKTAQGVTYV